MFFVEQAGVTDGVLCGALDVEDVRCHLISDAGARFELGMGKSRIVVAVRERR